MQTPMQAALIVKPDPLGRYRIRLDPCLKYLISPAFGFEHTVPRFDVCILIRSGHGNAFMLHP